MDVTISKINPDRWKEYKQIRLEALKNEPLAFGKSYEEEENREPEEWRKRLENFTPPLFALVNNQVVGVVSYKIEETIKLSHIAEIYSVYVKKEFRGHGIAFKLLNFTLRKITKNKSIRKIKLNVTETQKPAIDLYKRLGFNKSGISKKELKVGKKYYNSISMEKIF